jgi:hypothetical protein
MLTIETIRDKVNSFPANRPAEELLDELVLLYKIEKGLQAVKEGAVFTLDEAEKEMELWWKMK